MSQHAVAQGQPSAEIAVIGGSGFYDFLADAVEMQVQTPFGPPSEAPLVGEVAGRRVAFLPRHGRDHRFLPHEVNYRANLWALRSLGVRQVLGPCAVGSLRADWGPGSLVVPDQIIDRTHGRPQTIYEGGGAAVHVSFADPYCPRGRAVALTAAQATGWPAEAGGTLVVINGPRFATRAESRWHAAGGGDLVGMTGMPEASVARELALCYTSLAVVTDLDAGFEHGEGVTYTQVMSTFQRSLTSLRAVVSQTISALPDDADCPCRASLAGQPVPFDLP